MRDFDQQRHIQGKGVGVRVLVLSGPDDGDIRFGFVEIVDMHGKPDAYHHVLSQRPLQERIERADRCGVPRSDGTHLDDLAVDEFDAAVGSKDAGFGHLVVVPDFESLPHDVWTHSRTSRGRVSVSDHWKVKFFERAPV